uniref:N-terminal methionine N(alpha)-acetyltransferase NatE n=1 Tax=Caligus clemensi TaxID=344056 RepID=C1C281_CALCM|nr:N-acetyltransferase NAT13 [Caligus clemensi]
MPTEEGGLQFQVVDTSNLSDFKKLCLILFPVRYPPSFFKSLIAGKMDSGDSCGGSLGYADGRPIGLVSWSHSDGRSHMLNLGVLAQHRRKGIGSRLLEFIPPKPVISLYVQSSNQEALDFYESKGFKKIRLEKSYYRRLDPPDAYFLEQYRD